jgi:hypothetical protein
LRSTEQNLAFYHHQKERISFCNYLYIFEGVFNYGY